MKHGILILLLGVAMAVVPAAAQQVWRCGADGRAFSDRPCPDGRVFAAGDPRSADEVEAARDVASRERQLADTLASERAERARVAPGSGLFAIGPLEAELQSERRNPEFKRQRSSKRHLLRHRPPRSGLGT